MTAQSNNAITLDQAISIAKTNSPRMKMNAAAIRQAQLARGENLEFGPTTVNYSWGQINGSIKSDNQLEVTQSLGSLLTPYYKNALVRQQVMSNQLFQKVVEKEITAEVKRAWQYRC